MEYKMIVRQTLFAFNQSQQGKLKLKSVKFLQENIMKKKNSLLLVTENNEVQFFIGGSTPVAKLTREQFKFVTAATKFFGHLPNHKQLPVWLWADSLEMSGGNFSSAPKKRENFQAEEVFC